MQATSAAACSAYLTPFQERCFPACHFRSRVQVGKPQRHPPQTAQLEQPSPPLPPPTASAEWSPWLPPAAGSACASGLCWGKGRGRGEMARPPLSAVHGVVELHVTAIFIDDKTLTVQYPLRCQHHRHPFIPCSASLLTTSTRHYFTPTSHLTFTSPISKRCRFQLRDALLSQTRRAAQPDPPRRHLPAPPTAPP